MLVVKIELWPHGAEKNKKQLHQIVIINTLKNKRRPEYGDYIVNDEKGNNIEITNHLRSNGAMSLVKLALETLLFQRELHEQSNLHRLD